MNRLPKAAMRGACWTALFTAVIQPAVLVLGQGGENIILYILVYPWFATVLPGFFVAKAIGWHLQVDEMTIPNFIFMVSLNALIGGLLGWVFSCIRCAFKRTPPTQP